MHQFEMRLLFMESVARQRGGAMERERDRERFRAQYSCIESYGLVYRPGAKF